MVSNYIIDINDWLIGTVAS